MQNPIDEFKIHPYWKFLKENCSFDEGMQAFGPFQGAMIFPKYIDNQTIEVTMPLKLTNRNYVGTQFGGSLYAMTDPFYMLLLMDNLGEDYIVWDKSARIDFIKPGRSTVKAVFHLSLQEIDLIKQIISEKNKCTRNYRVKITDDAGTLIALVQKEIYIRKKKK